MKETDKEFFDKNPSGNLDDLPKDIKKEIDSIFDIVEQMKQQKNERNN